MPQPQRPTRHFLPRVFLDCVFTRRALRPTGLLSIAFTFVIATCCYFPAIAHAHGASLNGSETNV